MAQLLKTQSFIDRATNNMYDTLMSASQWENRIWVGIGALVGATTVFTKIPFTLVPMAMIATSFGAYKLSQGVVGKGGIFYKLLSTGPIHEQKKDIYNLITQIRKDSLSPYDHVNLYNSVKIKECLEDTLDAFNSINAMGNSDLISQAEISDMENTIKALSGACDVWGKKIGSVQQELESKADGNKGKEQSYKFTLMHADNQKYIIYVPHDEIDVFLANVNIFDANLFLGNIYSKINALEVFLEKNIKITSHHYEQFLYFVKTLHNQTYKRFYHSTVVNGQPHLLQLRRIFNTFLQYEEKHSCTVVDWEQIDSIIRPIFMDNSLDEEYLDIKKTTYGVRLNQGFTIGEDLQGQFYSGNNDAKVKSKDDARAEIQNMGEVGKHIKGLDGILVPQSVAQLLSNDIEVDLALESLKARKVLFMQSRQDVMSSWTNLNRSKNIIEGNLAGFDVGQKKEISLLLDDNLKEVLELVAKTTARPMTETTKHQLIELCLARIFFIELHLSKYVKILEERQAMEFSSQIQYQKNKAQYEHLKSSK